VKKPSQAGRLVKRGSQQGRQHRKRERKLLAGTMIHQDGVVRSVARADVAMDDATGEHGSMLRSMLFSPKKARLRAFAGERR
jgi:hypothetical protein